MARIIPLVAGLVAGLASSVLAKSPVANSYDYIVVGGGTSGLVLARRLSDNPHLKILVIEAGPLDQHEDSVDIPGLFGTYPEKYNWNMTYAPSEHVANRSIPIPQGYVVGGGTILNAMIWNRGTKRDYDDWETVGAKGWGWDGMMDSFKKSEIYAGATPEISQEHDITFDPAVHDPHPVPGVNGVYASFSPYFYPSVHYYINASTELGVPLAGDSQGGEAYGPSYILHSQDPKTAIRCSARVGYYDPIKDRKNVSWLFGYRTLRLILDGDVVTGAEFSQCKDCEVFNVKARKEVIVASGAMGTPALLQRSGIGPAKVLEAAGVKQTINNPNVGVGLSDHYMYPMVYSITGLTTRSDLQNNQTFAAEARAQYDEKRTGPFSSAGADLLFFLSSQQYTEKAAEIQAMAAAQNPMDFVDEDWSDEYKRGYAKQHAALVSHIGAADGTTMEILPNDNVGILVNLKPFSRGSVKISSADPWTNPVIDAGFLRNPVDVALAVEAYKFFRKVYATEAMAELKPAPLSPGLDVETDKQIEQFVRNSGSTIYHPVGSCGMRPLEDGGCVDPATMKVYGVKNLRVVDSSVMPMIVAAHTQAAVYAVAEKAATIVMDCIARGE